MKKINKTILSILSFAILGIMSPAFAQVSFTYNQPAGCAPVKIQLTNTSTQGNYYEWNIGGELFFEENPEFTVNPGFHYISLIVYDTTGGGQSFIGQATDFLVLKGIELQGFPSGEICVNELINPYAYLSGFNNWMPVRNISWDFGDGNTSTDEYPEHSYSSTGTYTVTFKGTTDSCGTQTITREITVGTNFTFSPWTGIYVPSVACPNTEVEFNLSMNGQGSPQKVEWNFGDGTSETLLAKDYPQWTSHNYTSTGTYNVTARIYSYCGNDTTVSATVEINNNVPVMVWSGIGSEDEVCPGDEIEFWVNINSSGSHTFQWNFGDGNTSTNTYPEHIYSATGTYNVSVKITNACGNDTTLTKTIKVGNNLPVTGVYGAYGPDELCPGDKGEFYAAVDNGSTYAYAWDFGDGNTSNDRYPMHGYNDTGLYNVSVKITNGCGNDTTLYLIVEVGTNVQLTSGDIDFDIAGDDEYCPGDNVTFVHWMLGMDVTIDFGDGSPVSSNFVEIEVDGGYKIPAIAHAYTTPGTYTVTLTAKNGCGSSASSTLDVHIINNREVDLYLEWADSTDNGSIVTCEAVYFYADGAQGAEVEWNFGDGTVLTSRDVIVKHRYVQAGTYTVTSTVTNGCGKTGADNVVLTVTGNPCGSVGIEKPADKLDFLMYPNPASSVVTIQLTSMEVRGNTQLMVLDMMGRRIEEKTVIGNRAELNISNYSPGIYLVKISNGSNQVVKKIVKE